MRISTKGEYGIRALLELSQRYGEGYIQSADIASKRNIPENYLYQLLITMRKAGLIRSRRGPQGGHMLSRSPEKISINDAVLALEGSLAPTLCADDINTEECVFADCCAVREVWTLVAETTHRMLEETSFAKLAERERVKRAG
ncbi:MAG: Rrf2 family transcriptional regulator [Chloroflexi bacterium]|nr:Rrf2 family transcriptional regulator [Chloroflexota bacterium]